MPSESQVRNLVRSIIEEALADAGADGLTAGGPTSGRRGAEAFASGGSRPASRPEGSAGKAGRAVAGPELGGSGQREGPRPRSVAIGADHGGYRLKDALATFLRESGWQVQDCGTSGPGSVDYPDLAHEVARLVADKSCTWGIIVDGAGIGSAMTANKVPGIRAALCYDISSARNSREHNHANILTLGAGLVGEGLARQIVSEWLATDWGGGRHERRVEKISAIERRYLTSGAGR